MSTCNSFHCRMNKAALKVRGMAVGQVWTLVYGTRQGSVQITAVMPGRVQYEQAPPHLAHVPFSLNEDDMKRTSLLEFAEQTTDCTYGYKPETK